MSLGDNLNQILNSAKRLLFAQAELLQLTYNAYSQSTEAIRSSDETDFTVNYPVGYRPDRTPIASSSTYSKENLLDRYHFLQYTQLGLNGILHLTTAIEAMFGDVLRMIVMKYPKKLGAKRNISAQTVLASSSIEEAHLKATDTLIGEILYKGPDEFSRVFQEITGINLMECPAYQRYIEIKATRDIYVHNRGVANELYLKKSGSHARVAAGHTLPVENIYFLESYESCLQLTEWLEQELHDKWHSSEHEARQQPQLPLPAPIGSEAS